MTEEILKYFLIGLPLIFILGISLYDYKKSLELKSQCKVPSTETLLPKPLELFIPNSITLNFSYKREKNLHRKLFYESFTWEGGAIYPVENQIDIEPVVTENDINLLPKELQSVIRPRIEVRYTLKYT